MVRALRAPVYVGVSGETAAFVDLEHSLETHLPLVLATRDRLDADRPVLDDRLGRAPGQGGAHERARPQRRVRHPRADLPARQPAGSCCPTEGNGALDATQPILLFAIGFGLATDYGVFLLSRIKEARDAGLANSEAVATGLERTGRIVTAAALLFAVAIGAFATSKLVFIKELGLGTALAVLIDAFVIRALLVPSLMELLGEWNWWAPAPLRSHAERSNKEENLFVGGGGGGGSVCGEIALSVAIR